MLRYTSKQQAYSCRPFFPSSVISSVKPPFSFSKTTRSLSSETLAQIGRVHSLYDFTTVDGPGIRYMIFLQGCLRRCAFCFNPDSWDINGGTRMTADDIMKNLKDHVGYMRPNNGGVTISGGDALLQPDFVAEIFRRAHEELGVTTCLDTSGLGHESGWNKVLPHTDLVLLCIKSANPRTFFDLTESTNESMIKFAGHVAMAKIPLRIRHVLIPGITDTEQETKALVRFARNQPTLEMIEVLPYHTLGVSKWEEMNLKYRLADARTPTREEKLNFVKSLEDEGFKVLCEE